MITKFEKYNLIKESPDKVYYKNMSLGWSSSEARPFSMTVNKDHTKVTEIYLGITGGAHLDMMALPSNVAYAGRFWRITKIISFWVYPNVELFKDFIQKLEDKLKMKIFNNGWKIEVLETDEGKIKRRRVDDNDFNYFFGTRDVKYTRKYKVIPIEEYIGSEDVPEEERIHTMTWQEKEQLKKSGKLKVTGGSHKTAWDSPHNIKYRQKIYQENKNN